MVSNHQRFHLFLFLCFFQITCLHAQLCTQEQSSALLQFKQQFSFNNDAAYGNCDSVGIHSYPKMESWNEGSDCCSWDGVECDNKTSQVIDLDLSCSWLNGTIHPNSTIFYYFPHLQSLNLAFNHFGMSRISSEFSRFTRLTHLNLSASSFSGKVPVEVSFLSKLVSLDLSYNHGLRLEEPGFELLVQNLTKQEDNTSSGFNWEVILPGYICGLVWGLVMGYFMFSRGKLQWLVRIIEGERNKSGKRFKRYSYRNRAR